MHKHRAVTMCMCARTYVSERVCKFVRACVRAHDLAWYFRSQNYTNTIACDCTTPALQQVHNHTWSPTCPLVLGFTQSLLQYSRAIEAACPWEQAVKLSKSTSPRTNFTNVSRESPLERFLNRGGQEFKDKNWGRIYFINILRKLLNLDNIRVLKRFMIAQKFRIYYRKKLQAW